jgi:hypothetical protein
VLLGGVEAGVVAKFFLSSILFFTSSISEPDLSAEGVEWPGRGG